MRIPIGEYVRTKTGYIGKVITREGGYGLIYQLNINKEIQDNWINGWVHEDNIVKHSSNIIDLIEDEDFIVLEYKTPRYLERITRKFEVSKIEDYINFENKHCSFYCRVGDKKIVNNICKNIKIKSIVTKEQFSSVTCEV